MLRSLALLLLCGAMAAQAEERLRIPLVPGLTVTTAIAEVDGDYESRKYLAARHEDGWRLLYSTVQPGADGQPMRFESERLLHDIDLAHAHSYRSRFEANTEEDYPGTTALGASAAVLNDLKTRGTSRFGLVGEDLFMANALAGLPGAGGSPLELARALMAGGAVSYKGELKRQSVGSLSVLVNGVPQNLPVVVASGQLTAKNGQSLTAELSFTDDPANALALQWRIGSATLRAVRIDFPSPKNALASALQQQKRITLPGLYFDFGSALLRPESQASLPAIAEAIRATPAGLLRLAGHTDSRGDAAGNQRLSLARATAVRDALISLDARLGARLKAEGFGATQPVAANTTLEGRAQNRRVELRLP